MWSITPFEGVGPIQFGMKKEVVRALLAETPDTDHYFRGPYTDYFIQLGVFVYYEHEDGGCVAIELTAPAHVAWLHTPLHQIRFAQAKQLLRVKDEALLESTFEGVTSHALGIALYAPNYYDAFDEAERVESVLVFQKGYLTETV